MVYIIEASIKFDFRLLFLSVLPVRAAGCSRKGTDLDLALSATDALALAGDDENETAEPMTARRMAMRNMILYIF